MPGTSGPGLDSLSSSTPTFHRNSERDLCLVGQHPSPESTPSPPAPCNAFSFLVFLIEKEKLTLSEHSQSQNCSKTILAMKIVVFQETLMSRRPSDTWRKKARAVCGQLQTIPESWERRGGSEGWPALSVPQDRLFA